MNTTPPDAHVPDQPAPQAQPADAAWDPQAKWVRIVAERANGMVEFEFAVGEPGLYVEMVMPRAPFDEFCAMHGVLPSHGALPPAAEGSDAHEWDWNLREARERHFRHEP